MSIQALAATLRDHGVETKIVIAKTAKKFDSIESFTESISDEAVSEYATKYHKWVKGGRKGSAPKADSDDYKALKYVRIVVSQL